MSDLLQQLDKAWADNGEADLRLLLSLVPERGGAEERMEAVADLCAADLEWRWRRAGLSWPTDDTQSDILPRRPQAEDYRRFLGDLWDCDDCRRQMYQAEWLARSLWGDEPDVDEFTRQRRGPTGLAEQLAAALELHAPLCLTVHHEDELQLCAAAKPVFTIGRQGQHDPTPPNWDQNNSHLIVVGHEVRSLSRRQLRIRRVSRRRVELKNISTSVRMRHGGQRLEPGESKSFPLPLAMRLDRVRIGLGEAGSEGVFAPATDWFKAN